MTVLHIVGAGVQGQGLQAIRKLCSENSVPPAALRDILAQLPAPAATDAHLSVVFEVEKRLLNTALREVCRPRGGSAVSRMGQWVRLALAYDVEATEQLGQRVYAQFQTNALQSSWAACDRSLLGELSASAQIDGLDEFDDGISNWESWFLLQKASWTNPNIFGERMIYWHARAADHALRNSMRVRTQANLIRAFIALRLLHKETGAYPESLREVVSRNLLPEVPLDFFDGKAIRYSAAKRRVWSVYENGIDDGGLEKKDLVLSLPE